MLVSIKEFFKDENPINIDTDNNLPRLKTTNHPLIAGVVYKLRGEIGEDLYITYIPSYNCMFYVGVNKIHQEILECKSTKDLIETSSKYRSLHYNDYKKAMKPIYMTPDFARLSELMEWNFGGKKSLTK